MSRRASPLFVSRSNVHSLEIARVLLRLDYVVSFIVNANYSIL